MALCYNRLSVPFINSMPVPLRTAAPSILRCTLALRDVTTRRLAGSAFCHLLFVFFFSWFSLTMDLSYPFLRPCFTSDPLVPPKSQWPETLNRSVQEATTSAPNFCCSMPRCPAGEFLKQLPGYQSVSCNL